MKTKKIVIGVIVSLLIVVGIVKVSMIFMANNEHVNITDSPVKETEIPDKLARLYESISYADGEVSFTIPDGDDTWNIHISGRIHVDGAGEMSIHYLEEESENNSWEDGKTYSFDVSSAKYSRFIELYLDAELNGEEISVDVLDFLPKYLKMRNDLEDNTVKTE